MINHRRHGDGDGGGDTNGDDGTGNSDDSDDDGGMPTATATATQTTTAADATATMATTGSMVATATVLSASEWSDNGDDDGLDGYGSDDDDGYICGYTDVGGPTMTTAPAIAAMATMTVACRR